MLTESKTSLFVVAKKPATDGNPAVFMGYSQEQLDAAFKKVQSPKGWKYPVNITLVLTEAEIACTDAAISYFAGSPSEFQPKPGGKVKVTAPGYYNCVGA